MARGYAGHNGQPYRSVGRWLVEQGELRAESASWPAIRAWALSHPERVQELLWANPRVVFFREEPLPDPSVGPRGAAGVPLTPGRSIAVGPGQRALRHPGLAGHHRAADQTRPLRRLVVAQDTGSAIVGAVRADFFWGWDGDAAVQAGRMRQPLRQWAPVAARRGASPGYGALTRSCSAQADAVALLSVPAGEVRCAASRNSPITAHSPSGTCTVVARPLRDGGDAPGSALSTASSTVTGAAPPGHCGRSSTLRPVSIQSRRSASAGPRGVQAHCTLRIGTSSDRRAAARAPLSTSRRCTPSAASRSLPARSVRLPAAVGAAAGADRHAALRLQGLALAVARLDHTQFDEQVAQRQRGRRASRADDRRHGQGDHEVSAADHVRHLPPAPPAARAAAARTG